MNLVDPQGKTRSLRLLVDEGQPAAPAARVRPLRIGWFLVSKDTRSASTRYRCHHMARILSQSGMNSVYMTDPDTALAEMKSLDAVIVVKRLDAAVLKVAAAAHRDGVPLFLDLCDDLVSDAYSKNADGINKVHFAALAALGATVTVPGAAGAERVRGYAAGLGLTDLPVHVIPDIAETRALYRTTAEFIDPDDRPGPAPVPETPGAGPAGRKRVVWYGNYGAPHSNFGILSLLRAVPALERVHRDIPLELVVISNNRDLFDGLTAGQDFAARYVPWSADAVYDALDGADVALLTGGDDAFCTIKSSNRTLQALASGVPVIAETGPALSEFAEIVLPGNNAAQIEAGLRKCLAMDPDARRRDLVAPAAPILARYSPQALAGIWRRLLTRVTRETAMPLRPVREAVLFLFDTAADCQALCPPLLAAHKAGLVCDVLMRDTLVTDPGLRQALFKTALLPRVYTDPRTLSDQTLRLNRALVLGTGDGDGDGPAGQKMRACARDQGLPVHGPADLPLGHPADWPAALVPASGPDAPPQAIQPGPYPERAQPDGSAKWVFVVHQNARGWILDAICREIGSRQPDPWRVAYNPPELPRAEIYFFSHFSLYQKYLRRFPDQMRAGRCLIWYTHPRFETPASVARLREDLDQAHQVICACSSNRDLWLARGLAPGQVSVVLGGADPDLFTGHPRGGGVIGLSSSFYERKNPDCLRDLVGMMPHRDFLLLGRNWEQYALFEDLRAAPNFTYKSAPYRDYPAIYAGFDVFLSMSRLEGGPIPLLEAMMENAVPVASDTGFAPDLIRHGENGFLFAPDAGAGEISDLLDRAFSLRADIRSSVIGYDWDGFARRIADLAERTAR